VEWLGVVGRFCWGECDFAENILSFVMFEDLVRGRFETVGFASSYSKNLVFVVVPKGAIGLVLESLIDCKCGVV